MHASVAFFLFLAIASIALFSFLAVAAWSSLRFAERDAYYKNESLKKIAESPEPAAALAVQYLRNQETERRRYAARKQRGGIQLGGLITVAIGIGLMVFLKAIVHGAPGVYLVGLIPLLIGAALLVYVYWFALQE